MDGRTSPRACTGCSSRPACCRRRPGGSTPTPRSAPTRCGSPSSGSTSTRPRSASSPRPTAATATPSAPPCWRSSPSRGKMQNPVTGSGGMLIGVVDEVGPESPLGLEVGDRVATLVSLTLTPLRITDGLARWDGRSRAGAGRGHGDPLRPLHRRRAARRPGRPGVAGGARRLRRPGRDRPGRRADRGALGRRARRGREVRLPQPRRRPRRGRHGAHRPGARRRRGDCAARRRAGRPGRRRRRHRPARRRGRRRHAGRRHRRLRRRAGLRARRDPGHGRTAAP